MKKFLWTGLIILLLIGCVGIPEPEGAGNSLIIGSLVLDFPDGFFDGTPNTFTNSIRLRVLNTTKNKNFTVSTSDGYFYFLTNGSDSYVIKSFEYNKKRQTKNFIHTYTLGQGIRKTFTSVPDRLVYLGHITFTYTIPDNIKIEKIGGTDYWSFDVSSKTDDYPIAAVDYIREIEPESSWPSYELVTF